MAELSPTQLQEIAQKVKELLSAESQGVGEVPVVTTLDLIYSLPALKRDGSSESVVEAPLSLLRVGLQKTTDSLQWRQGDAGVWQPLVSLEEISGKNPEFQTSDVGIEWKYAGMPDDPWKPLVSIDDLKLTFSMLTPEQKEDIRGYSSFQLWQQEPGNEQKTYEDYKAYLKLEVTEAADKCNTNEDLRVAEEKKRVSNDEQHQQNETTRQNNEKVREQKAQEFATNEEQRIANDKTRSDNETKRVSKETARETSEQNRQKAEVTRQSTFEKNIKDSSVATSNAVKATEECQDVTARCSSTNNLAEEKITTMDNMMKTFSVGTLSAPIKLVVETLRSISIRNVAQLSIKAVLYPSYVIQNVIFQCDGDSVSVRPDGSLRVNHLGTTHVFVVPTQNTPLFQEVGITVRNPVMRLSAGGKIRLHGNNIRIH